MSQNVEKTGIKGHVTVEVFDAYGIERHRQEVDNTITDAAKKYMLSLALSGGSEAGLLSSGASGITRSFYTRSSPTASGIYLLSEEVDIGGDIYTPPYVKPSNKAQLADNVVFYNKAGSAAESLMEMIPVQNVCYFDKTANEFVATFQKTTGEGTIKSIVIGRPHDLNTAAYTWQTYLLDIDTPMSTWLAASGTYLTLTENNPAGSTIYRTTAANAVAMSINLGTKKLTTDLPANFWGAAISALDGGLIVGDYAYKVTARVNTGGQPVLTINRIKMKPSPVNATAIAQTLTVNTTATLLHAPVLVARDDGDIDIFVVLSLLDGLFTIARVRVTVSDVDGSMTISSLKPFLLPYSIGYNAYTGAQYQNGLFTQGKYYLPIVSSAVGSTENVIGATLYGEGIIIGDPDLLENSYDVPEIHGFYLSKIAASQIRNPIIVENGIVQYVQAQHGACPYLHSSQVFSGLNLPAPVTKEATDTLRITYRYSMG
jgi:hypothetical protein